MSGTSRRAWLRSAVPLGAASLVQGAKAAQARKPRDGRRLLYNYDGWGPFLNGLTLDEIDRNVDQFVGTALTTLMFSPNVGQSMCYPSKVSEFCHTIPIADKDRARFHREMGPPFARGTEAVYELWRKKGIDAFGRMVERSRSKGFETFAAFRMNDVHMLHLGDEGSAYSDRFYREHPDYRLPGSFGLNYALPEVRQHRLLELEELITLYPFQGVELDFVRGVPYFSADASAGKAGAPAIATRIPIGYPHFLAASFAPVMTEFVSEVRAMTKRVAAKKGHPVLLAARVPCSLSGSLRSGLDPAAWNRQGSLDFLSISPMLQLRYDLPLAEFKTALPGLPVYSCVDFSLGGPLINGICFWRTATEEMYRGAAAALYSAGADGLQIFNMYVPRGYEPGTKWNYLKRQDPVGVLEDLLEPAALENKNKLYMVDCRSDMFDRPFFDSEPQLPLESTSTAPAVARLRVGERSAAGKRLLLRIEAQNLPPEARVAVQVNGRLKSEGVPAPYPRLFPESRDAMPPDARNCLDFTLDPQDLRYGENEVVVMSSMTIQVRSIELAVMTG